MVYTIEGIQSKLHPVFEKEGVIKAINELGKNVDFLYADDIMPGGKIDMELKRDGVLLYERG